MAIKNTIHIVKNCDTASISTRILHLFCIV